MSEARKGKGLGTRVFTDEHRAAISRSLIGKKCAARKPLSDDARQKMAASARAKYARGYINGRTRPVEINGVRYESGRDAAAALGVQAPAICGKIRRGEGRYL